MNARRCRLRPAVAPLVLCLALPGLLAAQPPRGPLDAPLPRIPASWNALALGGPAGVTAAARCSTDQALLFSAGDWVRYRPAGETLDTSGEAHAWDGWPASWSDGPDAAVRWDDRFLLLFQGPAYAWYSLEDQAVAGLPEPLAAWGLPWRRVEAAERWDESSLLLFQGGDVALFNHETGEVDGPHRVADWLELWPPAWFNGVQAALDMGDGLIYLFAHGGYLVLDRLTETLVTPYPIALGGGPEEGRP